MRMQIRIIFFIEICICSQKLTLMRIFGDFFPALCSPFPSLTVNPIQFLCLQVSSSALLFVKEKITANSPTLMNSPKVTCQQMYLRREMASVIIFKERTFWSFHKVYEYAKRKELENRTEDTLSALCLRVWV